MKSLQLPNTENSRLYVGISSQLATDQQFTTKYKTTYIHEENVGVQKEME
uniref:Uncharacterized protein n=1 Tax=Arundo donax TaxID=35708 RepID=A0A0A9HID0_ARUDO